ncbi:tetratricopeptide repeat protein [Aliivibrio fischeri]|uniref:tetratricopeptide repeat protein n=1 Tax=Aliivibrio fischeri TaxID=668 RepID=UPI0037368FF1
MMKKLVLMSMLVAWAVNVHSAELSKYTANKVQRAQSLQQQEKLNEAIEVLGGVNTSKAYDKAFVARMLGVFYWENNQKSLAIKNLDYAVSSGELKDTQAWVTERMLADLLLMEQQYKKALPHYYQLVKSLPKNEKGNELWLRIAQIHYQLTEFTSTLKAIQRYESYRQPDSLTPLSLKFGSQVQLKQWKSVIPTLERLIVLEPEKLTWWRQLVTAHLQLHQTKQALSVLVLADRKGLPLPEQDIMLLAQLYAKQGIPEQAAITLKRLSKANTDVDLLVEQAVYWQQAKEWQQSILYWGKAAKVSPRYYWQEAQLLLQQKEYQLALASLAKVKDPKKKQAVLLAQAKAYYKLNRIEESLIKAKKANDITSTNETKGWVNYLSNLRKVSEDS